MPDTKVSATTNASALTGGEEWHGVQSAADVAISADQMKTYALTTPLAVVGNATAGAELRLPEDTDNGAHYVALKAPDSLAASYTLTFPADDGASGEVLSTNGSGTLSWVSAGGASAPLTLASGTLTNPSAALTITQTWNDGADTFIAMDMTVTNTASAAASRLLRLNYGAAASEAERFGVDPAGGIWLKDGTNTVCLRVIDVSGVDALSSQSIGTSTQHPIYTIDTYYVSRYGSGANDFNVLGKMGCGGGTIGVVLSDLMPIQWSDNTTNIDTLDTTLWRIGVGSLGVRGSNKTTGGALNFLEQTAPSAPSANQVVVYAEDNGSGKTRLMARFNTGAAQQIAIEP